MDETKMTKTRSTTAKKSATASKSTTKATAKTSLARKTCAKKSLTQTGNQQASDGEKKKILFVFSTDATQKKITFIQACGNL